MSRRLARAIVMDRAATPFVGTRQLAELAARVIPHKPMDIHPATRAFQALRIAVNDELGQLVRGLCAAEKVLAPGGRLAVVSFHSLEDRIVKQFFAQRKGRGQAGSRLLPGEPITPDATFETVGRQPVVAGEAEIALNPRSRSAKLRVATRTGAPARGMDQKLMELATLPDRRPRRRP
jgi:16S rRNA (cytosine1402-N4)-methyltransferase